MAFDSIRIRGDARLNRSLRELSRLGTNKKQVHAAMAATVMSWALRNFDTKGSKLKDGRWPKASLNTFLSRKKGVGHLLLDKGKLRGSLNQAVTQRRAAVGFSDKKAKWHHFGTRPYTITPKNKKFLRFQTTGGTVFTKEVNHPGLPARRILPKESEVIDDLVRQVNLLVQKKIRRLF